jgi:outer membrane protein assembly factor BamD
MLAEKDAYIANFYFIRKKFDSAQRRYELLLTKYPNLGFDEEAQYRAGIAAFEQGENLEAKRHMETLMSKYPNSSYTSQARDALEKYAHP